MLNCRRHEKNISEDSDPDPQTLAKFCHTDVDADVVEAKPSTRVQETSETILMSTVTGPFPTPFFRSIEVHASQNRQVCTDQSHKNLCHKSVAT